MKKLLKDLTPFIRLFRPHYRRMGLGTFLGWLSVMASVGLLGLSGWFISAAAFAGLSLGTAYLFNFFYPSIGVRLFAFTRTLSRYAERIVTHDATFRMLATLRLWFYQKIEPLAPARLMQYRSADILNRIVLDIETLDNLYVRVLSPSMTAFLTIVGVVLFLALFDVWIAGTALLFLLISGIALPLAAAGSGADIGRHLTISTGKMRMLTIEGIQGLSELLVFGAWNQQIAALEKESSALIQYQGRMSRIRGLSLAGTTLLTGLAILTCLYIGVNQVGRGMLDGANLALVGFAVLASFEALSPLPAAYQYLGQTKKAAERLLDIVNAPPAVIFSEVSMSPVEHFHIHFDSVDFRYGSSAPWILERFDLHIGQGQHVAILGETGTGKSTLFNLLVRFWDPVRGSIQIGDHDLNTFTESDLRQTIGVVSQQTHLFHTTLRKNLLMARPEADETALRSALEKAQLLDWVEALPQGLDTWIGEAGKGLSGGQARRLSLSRMFLQNAPIWVLDEPTEGLDRITERKMMQALFHASQTHTLLVITHRTADLDRFDEIILMDKGRIVARGSHDALLKTSSEYAALIERG
ncbi:MAG: cysteine/glutathione ABC transporter ATP-binding protein/permease CydC [Desulfobacterales bacterium]|nr:cysteine/glutathione ABC transporter ATP-binding protein/permease CydC [Desulfobacterales bacterium]MDX2510508.1 cysteine/glutathione ABC transporter ATP-binding protein/permease CydC [Desulfobacterales bacterium]